MDLQPLLAIMSSTRVILINLYFNYNKNTCIYIYIVLNSYVLIYWLLKLISLWWLVMIITRILVWADGYYNGAIKTRKTVQPMEVSTEEASLQRSQQLRELYDSLSAGETNQPPRRPCAALSPEDLTESEWFYLMCVSFSFPPGTG